MFDAEALSHVDATGIEALRLELFGEDHLYPTVRAAVRAGESSERGEDAPKGVAHPLMVKAGAPARRRQKA